MDVSAHAEAQRPRPACEETGVSRFTAQNYPAGPILQSSCDCATVVFTLEIDDEQGCARRTCVSCGGRIFIADSVQYWGEVEPGDTQCPCGEEADVPVLTDDYAPNDALLLLFQ